MKVTRTKEFTEDMLEAIYQASESVCGTNDYMKYYMETETQKITANGNKYWKFTGWGIPMLMKENSGIIKYTPFGTYIIVTCPITGSVDRFRVCDDVLDILDLYDD